MEEKSLRRVIRKDDGLSLRGSDLPLKQMEKGAGEKSQFLNG
jgi:hypothetical protein